MGADWDYFFCEIEESAALIFVDLALESGAPHSRFPDLTRLRIPLREPDSKGLASKEEVDAIWNIVDKLDPWLESERDHVVLAGRCTHAGHCDVYFYSADSEKTLAQLARLLAEVKGYELILGSRPDPEWEVYRHSLYPTPWAQQVMSNTRVLDQLREADDRAERLRDVIHAADFPDASSLASFRSRALERGYREVDSEEFPSAPLPHRLSFAVNSDVLPATITAQTMELFEWSEEFGGTLRRLGNLAGSQVHLRKFSRARSVDSRPETALGTPVDQERDKRQRFTGRQSLGTLSLPRAPRNVAA